MVFKVGATKGGPRSNVNVIWGGLAQEKFGHPWSRAVLTHHSKISQVMFSKVESW